jgi:hypothetical protein
MEETQMHDSTIFPVLIDIKLNDDVLPLETNLPGEGTPPPPDEPPTK